MQTEKMVKVLELLKDTMAQVLEQEKPIFMASYFYHKPSVDASTTIHNCGTPACVAGYAALNPEVLEELEITPYKHPTDRARDVWGMMRHLETDDRYHAGVLISNILFDSDAEVRAYNFMELFPDDPDQFNHLTEGLPEPEDVIELIDFIIGELQSGAYVPYLERPNAN